LSCDEVTTIDNQSWISMHSYVVQDWCQIYLLIFLEHVIEGGGAYNLTKVIMGALKEHGGLFDIDVAIKLISFGVDGVNVFKGVCNDVFTKCKISIPPIWKAFIAWHITPI
jgi:hypothetical protein